MSIIVAIGGGEIKDLETLPIDREIVRLSGKKRPIALFIPTASADALGYVETFREIYGRKLGCSTDVLFLVREQPSRKEIEKKILSADIIYVGGGNTLRMLLLWRKLGIDMLLRKAYRRGIVLSGISAGAICWFRYGLSDARKFQSSSRNTSFMRIRGLDLIPAAASPHHIQEKSRNSGFEKIMRRSHGIGFAIDDKAALVIEGDGYRIISSESAASVRRIFLKKGRVTWEPLRKRGSLPDILKK